MIELLINISKDVLLFTTLFLGVSSVFNYLYSKRFLSQVAIPAEGSECDAEDHLYKAGSPISTKGSWRTEQIGVCIMCGTIFNAFDMKLDLNEIPSFKKVREDAELRLKEAIKND